MKLLAFLFIFPTFIACVTLPPLELAGVADQDANSAEYSCVSNCSVNAVPVQGKETEACDGSDLGCTPEDDLYVQEPLDKRGKTLKKTTTSAAKVTPKKTTSSSKTTSLKNTSTQAKSIPVTTSSVKTSSQVETTLKSQTTTSELSKSSSQTELSSSKLTATSSSAKPSSTLSTVGKSPTSTSSGATTASVSSAFSTASAAACNLQRAPAQKVSGKPFTGAKNTIMSYDVDCKAKVTTTHQTIITSLVYPNNLAPTQVTATCKSEYGQACYHYSSVISNNKQWATLTCPEAAATSANDRKDTGIVDKWSTSRNGKGWIEPSLSSMSPQCDRDEYPPVYLIDPSGSVAKDRGTSKAGQRLRVLPKSENADAAKMWTGICFTNALPNTDAAVIDAAANKQAGGVKRKSINPTSTEYYVAVTAAFRPEFTITSFNKKDYGSGTTGDGLEDNPCWPKSNATLDPGWALMNYDEYYDKYPQVQAKVGTRTYSMPKGPYNYKQPYDASQNGKNGGQNKWAWP